MDYNRNFTVGNWYQNSQKLTQVFAAGFFCERSFMRAVTPKNQSEAGPGLLIRCGEIFFEGSGIKFLSTTRGTE